MSTENLWDLVVGVTLVMALIGAASQLWYVIRCRGTKNSQYWTGIKTTNGVTLLFVAGLCILYLTHVPVLSIFTRLTVLMLVYNLAAGGLVSVVRVLRMRPRGGDPCD